MHVDDLTGAMPPEEFTERWAAMIIEDNGGFVEEEQGKSAEAAEAAAKARYG